MEAGLGGVLAAQEGGVQDGGEDHAVVAAVLGAVPPLILRPITRWRSRRSARWLVGRTAGSRTKGSGGTPI